MAQPAFYDIGLDLRLEQMASRGVPQAVRGKAPAGQGRADLGRQAQVLFHEGAYAETGEGPSALIDEEAVLSRLEGLTPMAVLVELEQAERGGPQRGEPLPLPLAGDGNSAVGEIEPGQTDVCRLLGACSGVVDEGENGQIPEAIRCVGLRLREQGRDFPAA